jgi:membrane-bound serine protease (ClpP class)
MKLTRIAILILISFALIQPVFAQSNEPLAIVMTADGPIMPPMLEYFRRGIKAAEQQNAEVLIIQLNTPGGSVDTMLEIITEIRASTVPVVVYVSPNDAIAGSAGALITMAGHASAMAPRTAIGASSPIESSGADIESTLETKVKEILKARARALVEGRGTKAVQLAEAMIDDAKAVTAKKLLKHN